MQVPTSPHPHQHVIFCVLYFSYLSSCKVASHCSSQWLLMLSIFSCAYWPFVFPLQRVIQISCPLSNWAVVFTVEFSILFIYPGHMICKYFLPFHGLSFHFLYIVFWITCFNFWWSLFFCCCCTFVVISKKALPNLKSQICSLLWAL